MILNYHDVIRVLIASSMAVTFLSVFFVGDPCYVCDFQISLYLLILHSLLLMASYLNHKLLDMLILTLLVFYVSRVGMLQFDLNYFVYENDLPSIFQMREVLAVLLVITLALLLGCILGGTVKSARAGNNKIFLYSNSIRNEEAYYRYLVWIFLVSKIILICLFIDSGIGLGIDLGLFDINLLRLAKAARALNFLGVIPIAWLIIKKTKRGGKKSNDIRGCFICAWKFSRRVKGGNTI